MKLPSSLHGCLVLASLVLRAAPALAHAGLPETSNVTVRRGHPTDLFAGTTFGAVVSRDGGKSWRWICDSAMTYGGWRPEAFIWQPGGDLLAATGASLIRSRDGGCTWTSHTYFTSRSLWPTGLASPASNPSRLWVTTGRTFAANGLYRSDDGGDTFQPTALQRPDALFTAVKLAPSDPRRLYVSGHTPNGLRLYRSDDEGASWRELTPALTAFTRPYDLLVLHVAETDPDRLWARVSSEAFTYVLESKDGGHTFQSVLTAAGRAGIDEYLVGIETSADGNTLWAATPTRFFRSRNGQPADILPLPEGNACVERQGNDILVCGSTWVHDWALARTRDEGNTYEPLFSLPDIQPPACPAGTPVQDICTPRWPQFAPSIGADPTLVGEPDAGTPDAGTPGPLPDKQGCSSTGGAMPVACLLALTLSRRSRRRHPET